MRFAPESGVSAWPPPGVRSPTIRHQAVPAKGLDLVLSVSIPGNVDLMLTTNPLRMGKARVGKDWPCCGLFPNFYVELSGAAIHRYLSINPEERIDWINMASPHYYACLSKDF